MALFHCAFAVKDIELTRRFYCDVLGCAEGRSCENWIDFEFFGHQLSAHLRATENQPDYAGLVDGDAVPIPHFGAILSISEFKDLASRISEHAIKFVIEPRVRFEGKPGEQHTMFLLDPSGNALEFKAFASNADIFAT